MSSAKEREQAWRVRRREQCRRNYYRNREERIAHNKAYRQTHREQTNATTREYRRKHPEKARAKDRRRRETHREQLAEYRRAYRAQNPEKCAQWSRDFFERNPGYCRRKSQKWYRKVAETLPNTNGGRWQPEEEQLLQQLEGTVSVIQLAAMLGRSHSSVKNHLVEMRKGKPRRNKIWTPKEDKILLTTVGGPRGAMARVAEKIGCSYNAAWSRRKHLLSQQGD